MAEQDTKQGGPHLRGGLEGGELGRAVDPGFTDEQGTPGISNPSGGVRYGRPSDQPDLTGLESRIEASPAILAGGRTPEAILGYLRDVQFPAKKDWVVRAARRAGAPDDMVRALETLPKTDYPDADTLLRDYPPLPDLDDVEPTKGVTGGALRP